MHNNDDGLKVNLDATGIKPYSLWYNTFWLTTIHVSTVATSGDWSPCKVGERPF